MSSRRLAKVQDLIREEVSRLLVYKVKDPRLHMLSVTRVKMTADLRQAVVFYCLLDEAIDHASIEPSLRKATGFFRHEIGEALNLKFVPEIRFEFDRSLEYARHMDQVLANLNKSAGTGSDDHSA